ncbi:MAG: cytochrome b/b6 domain-containing protein [Bacteriovorax sp.]|nr:cytochrome b/b6 domain-containing protein [Bacteriovorax sp.]
MNDKSIIIREKHSRLLRYSHWINFSLLSIMVWSGILIYWANDAYIKIPNSIAETFSIRFRLAEGMGWHFFIMWAFLFNGLIYVNYMIISGEWRTIAPNRKTFYEVIPVILHELKIKKSGPVTIGKFNAAQRLAYTGAILMGLGSVLTGIAIYKPVTLGWLTNLLGGYKAARFEHFLLMIGFFLFFIVHIIQVARAGWNNFRAMLAGYEIEKD